MDCESCTQTCCPKKKRQLFREKIASSSRVHISILILLAIIWACVIINANTYRAYVLSAEGKYHSLEEAEQHFQIYADIFKERFLPYRIVHSEKEDRYEVQVRNKDSERANRYVLEYGD